VGRCWADHPRRIADQLLYATQDKTWVNDPDGNEWEAFVVLKDNLAENVSCTLPPETCCAQEASSNRESL
jgi:hypothetical protein